MCIAFLDLGSFSVVVVIPFADRSREEIVISKKPKTFFLSGESKQTKLREESNNRCQFMSMPWEHTQSAYASLESRKPGRLTGRMSVGMEDAIGYEGGGEGGIYPPELSGIP